MNLNCDHIYLTYPSKTCHLCGLTCFDEEILLMDNSKIKSLKNDSNDSNFNDLLDKLPKELIELIKTKYHDFVLNKNQRSQTKKANLAVCYYFVLFRDAFKYDFVIYPCNYVIKKFAIKKKIFSKSMNNFILQKHNKEFCYIVRNVTDYVPTIIKFLKDGSVCDLNNYKSEICEITDKIKDDLNVINENPSTICSIVILNFIEQKNIAKIDITIYGKLVFVGPNTLKKYKFNLKKCNII